MFPDAKQFLQAIAAAKPAVLPTTRLTGITVPHHLLAIDLISRGFWAASASHPHRVIIMAPDHFRKSTRVFTTSQRAFCTALGCLQPDMTVTGALLRNAVLVNTSDLFLGEHGIGAELPFIAHFFPDAKIVPIVISVDSNQRDWDKLVAMLRPFVDKDTLIIQSTDFSHYLPLGTSLLRDQETLNVLASDDAAAVPALRQSDHIDSKAAQYVQLRLQTLLGSIGPIVVASRNAYEYRAIGGATTYIDELFAATQPPPEELRYDDQDVLYFAGDVLLGRYFTQPLTNPAVRSALQADIRKVTGGGKLVVNLEGYVLGERPAGLGSEAHMMYEDLAVPFLKSLNVVAAGLANNHSSDLGEQGLQETVEALRRGGIVPMRHGEIVDLGPIRVLPLNFIPKNSIAGFPFVHDGELSRLCQQAARPPLVAFVHWGQEYVTTPAGDQRKITLQFGECGIGVVVGAHSHRASLSITDVTGGSEQMTYSLGNFLFDQRSPIGSGSILEMRIFRQGTIATRLIPIPNLFDRANAVAAVIPP